jgi:hypothetical protein
MTPRNRALRMAAAGRTSTPAELPEMDARCESVSLYRTPGSFPGTLALFMPHTKGNG